MANPWLQVPLADYEGHMEYVGQARMLDRIFGEALRTLQPRSVAVLGAAGGSGFSHLATSSIVRAVAVDLNRDYLLELERRFGDRIQGLEIVCGDLGDPAIDFAPVALVHAALIFEYVDMARALHRIRAWLLPDGVLTVVLQLPDQSVARVSPSPFGSVAALGSVMNLQGTEEFRAAAAATGFIEIANDAVTLPTGKRFFSARYQVAPVGWSGQTG
jgi:hypothetical protein